MKSEDVMEIRGALDLLRRDVKDAKSDLHEFVMDGLVIRQDTMKKYPELGETLQKLSQI